MTEHRTQPNGQTDAGGRHAGPRCIALLGPFASGKTTLLEAILARTGALTRQGSVAAGTSVGDASPEARAHGMSVEVNVAETDYLGDRYTFLDCPGSVEFPSEAQGVLGGVDMAVVVAEADDKKIPALQLILKTLEDRGIPRVLFLNKIDRTDRRVREVLAALQPASAVPLVLRQIPIWKNGIAMGFIDLALERAFVYREHAESLVIEMPDDEHQREVEARFSMLERLADHDDVLMEALLEDIAPGRERIFADLVTEMRQGLICPVFIGSADHGNGIQRLMKALRHEAPGIAATRHRLDLPADCDAVQVLKTLHTSHGGKLSLVRVLSGRVSDATGLVRADGSEVRVSGVFALNGQQTAKRPQGEAGETVALGKLEGVQTGETLGLGRKAPQVARSWIPEPVLSVALAAAERKDEVKLSAALAKLLEEDPGLRVTQGAETAETRLEGQGEMHLRVAQERLRGKYGLSLDVRAPKVAYRETIRQGTSVRGRHKKQSGGHGQFGDVALDIRPLGRGEGFRFSDRITGGVVPKQYIPAVGEGVAEALATGPLGFPLVDLAVTLTDGSYHSVDSSDQAFKMAAILAMREGLPACSPVLLEPVHQVKVLCPSEATPRINAIISARRGQLLGFDARPGWPGWDEVRALIPEADITDLIVELRSATSGVGSYTHRFDHLAELVGKAADQVVQRAAARAA
ncbi:elongation factor G [Microvirga tunisiensis]|uniref:Elongation factor G n=1 Tax=Pannonibacter tanglangensis TaxID=2750084 RepID=A0A7X5J6W5_9HYPH|nr:elongation factor G [Pannonibacter sp. XCT-53]NBN77069.1 elongation factor G [Pannonibacter sp. XCT-53]